MLVQQISAEGFFIILKPCPIRVAAVAQFMKYLRDFVWSTTENSNGLPERENKKSYDIAKKQIVTIDRIGFWFHSIIEMPAMYRF